MQAGQRLDRDRLAAAPSRPPSRARCPAPTGSRSAPRRAAGRGGSPAGRRSCRGRARRAREGSASSGCRRRGRSACSRSDGCRSISLTIRWPASPAPTTMTSLPWATMSRARRPFDQRPREHPRARDEREQEQEVHDRDRPRQADRAAPGSRSRRRGSRSRTRPSRRGRLPTCPAWTRSATSGCRSRSRRR